MKLEDYKELQEFRYKCTQPDFVADELRALHQVIAQLKKRIETLENEVKPREMISSEGLAKISQYVKAVIAEQEANKTLNR